MVRSKELIQEGDGIFFLVKWLTLLNKTTEQLQGDINHIKFLKTEWKSQNMDGVS